MQDSDLHQQPNLQGPLGPVVPAYDLAGNAIRAVLQSVMTYTPAVTAAGVAITTSGTASTKAIPNNSQGLTPAFVRIASTAAAYVRFGATSEVSAAVSAAGTVYIPGQTITLTGGTFTTAATLTVATTKAVSATVAAGGSGGSDGTQTVTGTTGTGTKFQASVTVSGGAVTAVLSISVAGSYTANPTDISHEPVTGASLVGAQLAVVMGVATASVTSAGDYSVLPSNPVAQGSTSGSGSGATFTMTWATAASAGDILVQPGDALILPIPSGYEQVSAIQVTGAGIVQISPIG